MIAQRSTGLASIHIVMAGLVPAIHAFTSHELKDVDARDKRGHDG